ncbi:MAG: hypothetical protein R2867_05310 [Caldilineaceae bacterium]
MTGVAQHLQSGLLVTSEQAQGIEGLLRANSLWLDSFGIILRQNTERADEPTVYHGKLKKFDPADIEQICDDVLGIAPDWDAASFFCECLRASMDPGDHLRSWVRRLLSEHGRWSDAAGRVLGGGEFIREDMDA